MAEAQPLPIGTVVSAEIDGSEVNSTAINQVGKYFIASITGTSSLPLMPLLVYGSVSINNQPAPIGTIVSAEIDGSEVDSIAINQEGKYFLKITDGADNEGKIVVFKVNGILDKNHQLECVDVFEVPSIKLDLSVSAQEESNDNNNNNISSNTGGSSSGGGSTYVQPNNEEEDYNEEDKQDNLSQDDDQKKVEPVSTENQEENNNKDDDIIVLGVEVNWRELQLEQILKDAQAVWEGNVDLVLANSGASREGTRELESYLRYVKTLMDGITGLEQFNIYALTNFITYGTKSTLILGAGERAGVVNSYKAAFGKLPQSEEDWQDVIKIANGRWPSERSEQAEARAKQEFKKVYLREPDMNNPNDNAAVTIIAYGLRPSDRNLESEKAAIKFFKAIYKYNPSSAVDWDIVRAIAYSGAVR